MYVHFFRLFRWEKSICLHCAQCEWERFSTFRAQFRLFLSLRSHFSLMAAGEIFPQFFLLFSRKEFSHQPLCTTGTGVAGKGDQLPHESTKTGCPYEIFTSFSLHFPSAFLFSFYRFFVAEGESWNFVIRFIGEIPRESSKPVHLVAHEGAMRKLTHVKDSRYAYCARSSKPVRRHFFTSLSSIFSHRSYLVALVDSRLKVAKSIRLR